MPILIRSIVLLAALAGAASANDLSGTWRAWFVGPIGDRPKMVYEMTFDIKVDGDKVIGMAHVADWPGDAPISEGRTGRDRFWFTVVGKLPSSGGYPVLHFVAKPAGKEMQLTLYWGSGAPLEMHGTKISDSK